jgi:S-adenosylmethionine/arginine decarboxylase-like enzyme|tara:strand:- start:39 stop:482 length:444 start_codon:yes stop_codon:yes gene_type:complete
MLEHKHLLIRTEVKKPLTTEVDTINWLKNLVSKINMNILAGPYASKVSKKGNKGLSGVVIIDTSHIAIHTWDESDPALIQLDVYSCKHFKKSDVVECLEKLQPVTIDYKYFDRETNFKEILREDPGSFENDLNHQQQVMKDNHNQSL